MKIRVVANPAKAIAQALAALKRAPPGLVSFATGSTYAAFFRALPVELRFQATHLDEFVGLAPDDPRGMAAEILALAPALKGRFLRVPGTDDASVLKAHEVNIARAGGVGLQFLGLGRNGHLAFNEPGTSFEPGFHVAELSETTRADLAARFAPDPVPTRAATAGLSSIMRARRIVLIALGAAKAPAVRALTSNAALLSNPASCLRGHRNALVILDEAAATLVSARHLQKGS